MQLKKYIMGLFGRVYNIIVKRLKDKCIYYYIQRRPYNATNKYRKGQRNTTK